MMAALTQPEWVRCVVALGAPADLSSLHPDETRDVFGDTSLSQCSPASVVHPDAPPMLLVHGAHDPVVPIAQARAYAAGRPNASLIEVAEGDHGLRWPPVASFKARRSAVSWMVDQLDMPERGSKWKRRKKKNR